MNEKTIKNRKYRTKLKRLFGLLEEKIEIEIVLHQIDNFIYIKAYHAKDLIVKMINVVYKEEYIYICDIRDYIHSRYINKGIGTQMMSILIEFAKENGIKRIEGKLGVIDKETHGDRLEHFYIKQGFNINYYDVQRDGFCADIVKYIE